MVRLVDGIYRRHCHRQLRRWVAQLNASKNEQPSPTIDNTGYRQRWTTPCADLFGQRRRVLVALTEDRRSLLLVLPSDTVRLNEDAAHQLAEDIRDAAQSLPAIANDPTYRAYRDQP